MSDTDSRPRPSAPSVLRHRLPGRKLHVLHVVRALQTGGLETVVLESCLRMRRIEGVQAGICALFPGDGLQRRLRYRDVPVNVLTRPSRWNGLSTVLGLTGVLRVQKPDVVHIHNFVSQVRAAPAARLAGVPVVVTTKHGSEWPRLLGSAALAARFWNLSDALAAVSEEVLSGFEAAYGRPLGHGRVVLNGIDTERFRPTTMNVENARHEVLGMTGRPLLGTVGRLVEGKGISVLVEALGLIRREAPGAALVVVGDGPRREALQRTARQLGLADRVCFLGKRDDVERIYPLCDVYVQPSHAEGISLTILEACATGLPVVATDVGGNPEVIDEGRTGVLVPAADPAALGRAVLRLWGDPARARQIGRAARRRVRNDFSVERMVGQYMDLYRDVSRRKAAERRS